MPNRNVLGWECMEGKDGGLMGRNFYFGRSLVDAGGQVVIKMHYMANILYIYRL